MLAEWLGMWAAEDSWVGGCVGGCVGGWVGRWVSGLRFLMPSG